MFPSSKNIDGSNIDLTNYYTKTEIDTIVNSQGQAYIPCGSVQAFMTITAPQGYLICDGTEYLKSSYPQLAEVLSAVDIAQSTTVFAGSDNDHFKVPDLRGEFLRGTGTNSHTKQGSGAKVGVHQDATTAPMMSGKTWVMWSGNKSEDIISYYSNFDYRDNVARRKGVAAADQDTVDAGGNYTTRPTNTSVLYCIAYQNLYLTPLHQYSAEEQIVGKWIDGKPVYERTIETNFVNVTSADNRLIANFDISSYLYQI